jgi:hypothetical protein
MDYSLLLGIHFTDREEPEEDAKNDQPFTPTSPSAGDDIVGQVISGDAPALPTTRRQSHYGLKGAQEVIAIRNEFASALPIVEEKKKKSVTASEKYFKNAWSQF